MEWFPATMTTFLLCISFYSAFLFFTSVIIKNGILIPQISIYVPWFLNHKVYGCCASRKRIHLDVYVNDKKETVYNVEMQRGKRRELPKRSRYYANSIDLDLISSGMPYTALKKALLFLYAPSIPFRRNGIFIPLRISSERILLWLYRMKVLRFFWIQREILMM